MSYTKEHARNEISKLVTNFRGNKPSLVNVSEAQIEQNYIRKLFRFLNWNTDNTGLSVAEWEFVLQRTDEKGKRPDYILQLDGQQLLVMDAKKIKYDMHDPRWMKQVYAYAYSTQNHPVPRKIDFAILTDFQEFVLLDCTLYAADPKAVSNFRILDWTCEDYVSQFDTLWGLFERENVRAAVRTRGTKTPYGLWACYLSPKKVKANRIPPDKAFLSEMDDEKTGWRVRIAKDMKKHNPEADGLLITAAVQLLINRLIFVKALSDHEIEEDYLTQLVDQVEKSGLAADDIDWFNACRDIFAKLNRFYDGSIFEPRPELESVNVSNKVVREVIGDFQPENSPYNFAVLPVEILGTIYERFLGRVVRTTDSRVKIEDKPEVRKAGGVYYTPQYIVDYIVENTVGKLLFQCKTPADVAKLKILDPACGSGSFLVRVYTMLIRWHEAYYSDKGRLTKRDREAAYYETNGGVHLRRVRLTAKLKRQILLNNIFGVDIDAQATEVTRFSLSLKALEDTRRDELHEEVNLFKQTILPDLDQNVKCGNSLIGPDYFSDQLLWEPEQLKRINPFDWDQEFVNVMRTGGFDCIIGNPPYVDVKLLGDDVKTILSSKYAAAKKRFDLYVPFVEKSLLLLRKDGLVGFILPSMFACREYGRDLRNTIGQLGAVEKIVDFGTNKVFSNARNYVSIFVFSKSTQKNSVEVIKFQRNKMTTTEIASVLSGERINGVQSFTVAGSTFQVSSEWYLHNSTEDALAKRLFEAFPNLESLLEFASEGIHSGKDEVFFIPATRAKEQRLESPPFYPLAKGKDIHRYETVIPDKLPNWVLYPYDLASGDVIDAKSLRKNYPRTWKYLEESRELLAGRPYFERSNKNWYELWNPRTPRLYTSSKIVGPEIANKGEFTIYKGQLFVNNKVKALIPKFDTTESLEYLLGILNSNLMVYLHRFIAPPKGGGFFEVKTAIMGRLPIRRIDFANKIDKARHDQMVKLVETTLTLYKRKAEAKAKSEKAVYQRQIDAIDLLINALVYELYNLTDKKEIEIIDKS